MKTPESIPEQRGVANDVFMGDKRHRVEIPTGPVWSRVLSSLLRRHCAPGDDSGPPENPERRDEYSGEVKNYKEGVK